MFKKIRSNKHTEKKRKISEKETGKMLDKNWKKQQQLYIIVDHPNNSTDPELSELFWENFTQ